MNQHGDIEALDAFGERTPAPRPFACTPSAARARRVAVAVFWSLALMIVAGRVYYGPIASLDPAAITLASR